MSMGQNTSNLAWGLALYGAYLLRGNTGCSSTRRRTQLLMALGRVQAYGRDMAIGFGERLSGRLSIGSSRMADDN